MIVTITSGTKGGVGKSALTILTANNLAARGKKVLVIDYDCNNSSTLSLTMGIENINSLVETHNTYKMLSERNAKGNIIAGNIDNLFVIPSSIYMADLRSIDEKVLKQVLDPIVNEFDFILIDTAPNYDNHLKSALYAADFTFTPMEFTQDCYNAAKYLRLKITTEIDFPGSTEKYNSWFIIYARWESQWEDLYTSQQAEWDRVFQAEFKDRILESVKIPKTTAVNSYVNYEEVKLRINNKTQIGNKKLAIAINEFCNLLCGFEPTDTSKYVEEF